MEQIGTRSEITEVHFNKTYALWVRCPVCNLYYDFSLQKRNRNEAEQLQVVQPLSETGNIEMPLAADGFVVQNLDLPGGCWCPLA